MTRKKSLKDLLKNLLKISESQNCDITGLALDSRKVHLGDLFIAYPGTEQDGRHYIDNAVQNGAAAIICEELGFSSVDNIAVPVITIANLQQHVGEVAASFYDYPSHDMTIVGITGTNGKTSCSHYLAAALEESNIKCGIIGTLGAGFIGDLTYGQQTTPDPITLQQQLYDLRKQGAKAVAMEVSSHGLQQDRAIGVEFNIAVFTNLSQDHLDYHGDMHNYGEAKKRLFLWPGLEHVVINVADTFGERLLEEVAPEINKIAYSTANSTTTTPIVQTLNIAQNDTGFVAELLTPWGGGVLTSTLLGEFNISNLLAVVAVLGIMQVPLSQALATIAKLQPVAGRMQALGGGKQPLVVVDFSHTPAALEQALLALRSHCKGALWCVFGCGGDRDKSKRPLMGQIAEQYSDQVVITDDNPRTEDPQTIVAEIVAGLLCPWAAEVERDRGAAIAHAIECTKAGDIVLVAGKGHEPYQIVGNEKIAFSDIAQVKKLLA